MNIDVKQIMASVKHIGQNEDIILWNNKIFQRQQKKFPWALIRKKTVLIFYYAWMILNVLKYVH